MSMDTFHFEGYGLLQLETIIFPLVKPTHGKASPYEMYEDDTLTKTELPKESKIILNQGMWDEYYSDDVCENPGTVPYIPQTTLNILNMKTDDTLNILFAEVVKLIITNAGLELLPDANIDKAVADNICEFESESAFY